MKTKKPMAMKICIPAVSRLDLEAEEGNPFPACVQPPKYLKTVFSLCSKISKYMKNLSVKELPQNGFKGCLKMN